MSMPPKTQRNKELFVKRVQDPQKWSWRALGEHYGIHFTTAKGIFLNTLEKISKESDFNTDKQAEKE